MKKLILGIAILAIAVMSQAQRGGGFMRNQGGPVGYISREDVQKELVLTDEQKEKITAITDSQQMGPKFQKAMEDAGLTREDFGTADGQKKMPAIFAKIQAEIKKEIEVVLTPTQITRWNEVSIQLAGNLAAVQPEVGKLLVLTDDQSKLIAELQKKQMDATRGLGQQMRDGSLTFEEFQTKQKKNTEIMDSEVAKILTDAQKAKLKELGGKKFERKDEIN